MDLGVVTLTTYAFVHQNVANPVTAQQKTFEIEAERAWRPFVEKKMGNECVVFLLHYGPYPPIS
jgi:hypothetical protein